MNIWFNVSFYSFFVSFLISMLFLTLRKRWLDILQELMFAWSFLSVTVFIAIRWLEAGRPPFSNLFESLVAYTWTLGIAYLVLRLSTGLKQLIAPISIIALGLLGYGWLQGETEIVPLLPALQNNFWLTTHVLLAFIGYSGFSIGLVLALMHLMGVTNGNLPFSADQQSSITSNTAVNKSITGNTIYRLNHSMAGVLMSSFIIWLIALIVWVKIPPSLTWQGSAFKTSSVTLIVMIGLLIIFLSKKIVLFCTEQHQKLERATYLSIIFGFPFLGVGILSGSVWANVAWGSYWGWDPKETSSLVTWLIFAIYLHLRLIARKKSPWLSWLVVLGFFAVIFTYFGVNYLDSLHSYGA